MIMHFHIIEYLVKIVQRSHLLKSMRPFFVESFGNGRLVGLTGESFNLDGICLD